MQNTVVLVCHGTIVREAFEQKLAEQAITVEYSIPHLAGWEPTEILSSVGIYVETVIEANHLRTEAALMGQLDLENWIVLSASKDTPLYTSLIASDKPACSLPLETCALTIAHAVGIAYKEARLCVDDRCEHCPMQERYRLDRLQLEPDELHLLEELSDGASNKAIARHFDCTESTIKSRLRSLMSRLGVQNRTQAAVLGARAGLRGAASRNALPQGVRHHRQPYMRPATNSSEPC